MKLLTKVSAGLAAGVLAVSLFSCGGWKEVKSSDFITELDKLEETDVTKAKVEIKIEGNDDEANNFKDVKTIDFNLTKVLNTITFVPTEVTPASTAIAAILDISNLSLYKDLAKNYTEPTGTQEDPEFKYVKFYVGNGFKIGTNINNEAKDNEGKVVTYSKMESTIEYNKAGLITKTYENAKVKKDADKEELWHKEEITITYSK